MVKVYLVEDVGQPIVVTREINLPRIPSTGDTFNFMDGAGQELATAVKLLR